MVLDYRTSVKVMRVLCPAALLAALALGAWSWSLGRYELLALNGFLAGFNAMLTWIQWRWFSI